MTRIKPSTGQKPPRGVTPELHKEIMRRINNRGHENHDICSLRRGGPGLAELAGIVPLVEGLPVVAVKFYARQIARLGPRYEECARCQAKLCGFVFLLLQPVDPALAEPWLNRVRRFEYWLTGQGIQRDFIGELDQMVASTAVPRVHSRPDGGEDVGDGG